MPERRTARLRWARVSQPGAIYFVTLCTQKRERAFDNVDSAARACAELTNIHQNGDADILATTVMPDHVHLLFRLGMRLRLGQLIGKFKATARDHGKAPWHWQEDGFEHQLRTQASTEDYGFYIFMNRGIL